MNRSHQNSKDMYTYQTDFWEKTIYQDCLGKGATVLGNHGNLKHHCFGNGVIRDPVGATLLHWAILNDTKDDFKDFASYLIKELTEEQLNLTYSRSDERVSHYDRKEGRFLMGYSSDRCRFSYQDLMFDGESAVHLAIATKSEALLKLLIKQGASLTSRAWGSFFSPGGDLYFGELPLSFAVSTNNQEAVKMLLDHNPKLIEETDTFGNTAFHIAVIRNKPEFYDMLFKYTKGNDNLTKKHVSEMKGTMQLTPLGLAALLVDKRDREATNKKRDFEKSIYSQIQESTKRVFWKWMGKSCNSYDLEQIDTQNEFNFVSMLYLTYQFKLYHLAQEPIIMSLMDHKWKVLRYPFYGSMLIHFLYIFLITVLVIETHPGSELASPYAWICLVSSLLLMCTSLMDFYLGVVEVLRHFVFTVKDEKRPAGIPDKAWATYRNMGPNIVSSSYSFAYLVASSSPLDLFDFVAVVGYILYFVSFGVSSPNSQPFVIPEPISASSSVTLTLSSNSTGDAIAEEIPDVPLSLVLLGFSAMCSWLSILRFSSLHVRTGVLVQVITRTIGRDLLPFIIVFVLFLMAAAASVFTLQKKHSLLYSIDALIRLALGIYEHESYEPSGHSGVAEDLSYILMVSFAVVCGLLLINLLIATFTSTYESIEDSARESTLIQHGHAILLLERRFSRFQYFKDRLRLNHNPPEPSNLETGGTRVPTRAAIVYLSDYKEPDAKKYRFKCHKCSKSVVYYTARFPLHVTCSEKPCRHKHYVLTKKDIKGSPNTPPPGSPPAEPLSESKEPAGSAAESLSETLAPTESKEAPAASSSQENVQAEESAAN